MCITTNLIYGHSSIDFTYAYLLFYVNCSIVLCVYICYYVHIGGDMRTNIVIDDNLMANVLKVTGLKTKREAVELGLKTLLRLKKQEEIKKYKGKLKWNDDLDRMRTD